MARKALLILQGGGAIGAFQCGAYKAIAAHLRRAGMELAGIAGTSIGALNGAVIARHHADADGGAEALERLWRDRLAVAPMPFFPLPGWYWNCWNGVLTTLLGGNPALSTPNYLTWNAWGEAVRSAAPLHLTVPMARLIAEQVGEFGPNPGRSPLLLVRAIDADTQQPEIFQSWREAVTPRHILASASIPLLYPLTELDGRRYWDGDLWPSTPFRDLLAALQTRPGPRRTIDDYLVIVIDTLSAQGRRPSSALDSTYQIVASMLAPRIDADEAFAELNNRYVDFLSACAQSSEERSDSPLGQRIANEHQGALSDGVCRIDMVRIRRRALPFEYVSRDLDYSALRVGRLIEQGYACALEGLASHA